VKEYCVNIKWVKAVLIEFLTSFHEVKYNCANSGTPKNTLVDIAKLKPKRLGEDFVYPENFVAVKYSEECKVRQEISVLLSLFHLCRKRDLITLSPFKSWGANLQILLWSLTKSCPLLHVKIHFFPEREGITDKRNPV